MSIILLGSSPVCLWVNNLSVWNVLIANGIWWDRCMITKIATQNESHHGSWILKWIACVSKCLANSPSWWASRAIVDSSVSGIFNYHAGFVWQALWKIMCASHFRGHLSFPQREITFLTQDNKPVARSNSMTTYDKIWQPGSFWEQQDQIKMCSPELL